jgi:hypothetical protein
VTFPLRHHPVPSAWTVPVLAAPGASAPQLIGKRPTVDATKALRLKPPYRAAAHGWKAPSTNAPSARPATWLSNGAQTAQPPANALAPCICPCCEEMITIEKLTENTAASQLLPVASTPIHH